MVNFTISADRLYKISKTEFCRQVPEHTISFKIGNGSMTVNMLGFVRERLSIRQKQQLMLLIITHAEPEDISKFGEWLNNYFSTETQKKLFFIYLTNNGWTKEPELHLDESIKNKYCKYMQKLRTQD